MKQIPTYGSQLRLLRTSIQECRNCWCAAPPLTAHFCPQCTSSAAGRQRLLHFLRTGAQAACSTSRMLEQRFYDAQPAASSGPFTRADQQNGAPASSDRPSLNDAYRTLKEPIARGFAVPARTRRAPEAAGSCTRQRRRSTVPPELLEEVFELNMALEEMRDRRAERRGPLWRADLERARKPHRREA